MKTKKPAPKGKKMPNPGPSDGMPWYAKPQGKKSKKPVKKAKK